MEEIKPVGKITPVDISTIGNDVKPVGKITPVGDVTVSKKGFNPYERTTQEEKMLAVGKVVNDLTFSQGYNEDEKKYLIDLAKNPKINYDQWNEAKQIVGGNHPSQGGFQTYYIGDDGMPKAVPLGQKPPKGKDIASIWGSQESAEDDNVATTIAKNVVSALPGIIKNVAGIPALAYGLATGDDAEWYNSLKNRMEALSPATSTASKEGFINTENIHGIEDIANMDNWHFTPDNIAGSIGSVIKSGIEFVAGGEIAKGIGLGSKIAEGVSSKLPYFVGSYMTNLGEALDAADEAGVKGRDKYAVASMVTVPLSLVDISLGFNSKLINNPEAQAQRKSLIQSIVKGYAKDSEGVITKEGADELFKTTLGVGASTVGNIMKDAAITGLEEGGEEVAQNAIQRASQQIYDNMYAENKKVGEGRYGKEIASPEAFADYINDFIAGTFGGGVGMAGVGKYMRAKADAQSENAYEYIKKGEEGVNQIKSQLGSALKSGQISQQQYDMGIHKVNTYNKYYQQTKDLGLDDVSNRRVFDLTWSNENLKQQQESLASNPESGIKGTIPHRRLLDTEALLESNSKEMSKLMAKNIADQQTAISVDSEKKLSENKIEVTNPATSTIEAKPSTTENSLINQINSAETPNDVDAYLKEADSKGVASLPLVEAVAKRKEELRKLESSPQHVKDFVDFTENKHPMKDWNNLSDVANSHKSDAVVEHLLDKGTNVLKDGSLELGKFSNQIVNGKRLPLYYDVDFGGKRIKLASSDYTNFIKEKNLVGKKVDVQMVLPTDNNLKELSKEGVIDSDYNVVERTDKNGNKNKWFVFDSDNNKKRFPYILVARLQTKGGNLGVKVGNLINSDYSDYTLKREGREGLRSKKKENAQKPGDVESYKEGQTSGYTGFDFESATPDYESQIQSAPIAPEDYTTFKDEGFSNVIDIDKLNQRKQKEQAEINRKLGRNKDEKPIEKKEQKISNKSIVSSVEESPLTPEKKAFVDERIKEQVDDGDFDYGTPGEALARKLWGNRYDKLINRENESNRATETEGNKNVGEEVSGEKAKRVRTGNRKPKAQRKIRDKNRLAALNIEVFNPYDMVLQYFIGEGKIHPSAIDEVANNSKEEKQVRIGLINKSAPTITELSHKIWDSLDETLREEYSDQDVRNAVEDVLREYVSAKDMTLDLLSKYNEKESEFDDPMAQYYDVNAEPEFVDDALDYWDSLTDDEKAILAKEAEENRPPDNIDESQKQKVKTLAAIEIEKEIVKAESELKSSKSAFEKKRKELDTAINEDNADLFGERKSSAIAGMFDERIDISARDKAIEPHRVRYEKAIKNLADLKNKLQAEEGKTDLTLFQKVSDRITESKDDRDKKISLLKKAIPGITVIDDQTIGDDVAGQLDADGKTVRLNPNYNFIDTPIHEFGHALIDMMGGVSNPVIKNGINQLRNTELWKETEARYPELSEDMLAKEVLAEAIGREGANIFSNKGKQSKFVSWLSGVFFKLKKLLGIEKNVAKNLANQLLSGKRIEGLKDSTSELVQQKRAEKDINKSKPMTYQKWLTENNIDELGIREEIANIKEEIADSEGGDVSELKDRLDRLESAIENNKNEYNQYVSNRKAVVDFINSKGDVSNLSLNELNEIRSKMVQFDDLIKTSLYRDLMYNLGAKANEIQIENIKSENPDYDPANPPKSDLTKTDIWAQGLSTISEELPAVQYFYKEYRKASGDMNNELSSFKSKAEDLAKAVISDYRKSKGIGESALNFLTGAGDKIFSFLAKDGKLVEKGTTEYNKLSANQKALLDFITEQKSKMDPFMDNGGVLLKSGAGFLETFKKSGLYKAYANYITKNHNLRDVIVKFKNPETGKISDMTFGDVESYLQKFGKKSKIANVQAMALLSKYNLQAKKGLETKKGSKGKYYLAPGGKLVSMFGGEYKGDFTTNYYESFMKYAQDAIFSKNMSPLMPMLTGVEMFYKSMGSDKENVVKFLNVVKKGKFLGETIESGLGDKADRFLRLLRKWTSWRFIAFNIPANLWNISVGEYNQFRNDGGKQYLKGKKRFFDGVLKGKKNAKAYNILKKYTPELVTDVNSIDPEKHIGRYFDMLAFGGQKFGEAIIRGSAIVGRLSTEHYNWLDKKGNVKGDSPEQIKERDDIIKSEMQKYYSQVEKVHGRYSDVEKRNFAHFELGQFFGQFKVWMPEWLSDRFSNTYIDADGIKRTGSFMALFNYGLKDFLRDATKKEFYTSNNPKQVAARKQLRGMIITSGLLLAYLSSSNNDDDKDMANSLNNALRNISGIYRMDNNTFLLAQPAASMATVVDLAKTLKSAMDLQVIKSGKNKGDLKFLHSAYNLVPGNKLISEPIDLLTDNE